MKQYNLQKYYFFGLFTFFVFALLLISFRKIYGDTDFFWHLKLGQMALENKEWITKEIFSLTRANVEWFNNTQIFDVSTWLIYKHFSYLGLFITRFIFYLFTFFFVYKIIAYKNKNWQIISFVFFAILSLLIYRSLFRPEIFAYFYTILYIYLLYTYKYTNKKLLYLIPFIQILWVNTHLSFVTGPAVIGVFVGGEFIRHLFQHQNLKLFRNKHFITYLSIFCLSLLANFISPYGFKTISWFWWIYSSQESLSNISEWQNPSNNVLFTFNNFYNLPYLIIIWSSIYVLAKKIHTIIQNKFLPFKKYSQLPWEDILLLSLFLYQSLVAVRFAMISTMIAGIILAKNWPQKYNRKHLLNTLPILGVLLFLLNMVKVPIQSFGLGYSDNMYPIAATQFIKDQKLSGNMINDYNSGGYLIWALYPEKKIFMDSRTPNVYDDNFYWYWRSSSNENIRKKLLNDYEINFWLWPNDQMSRILWEDDAWTLIYFDNLYTIYIQNTPENKDVMEKFSYQFFAPYFNEYDIQNVCSKENLEQTPDLKNKLINELNNGLSVNNQSWLHYKNLALVYQNCQFDTKDQNKITNYLEQANSINKNDAYLNYLLGLAYLQNNNNNNELALKYFKQSGKTQASYLIGLGTAQYNLGEYKKALKTFLAVRNTPGEINNKYYQNLARVYYSLDKYDLAVEFHQRYIDLANDHSAETYTDLVQSYFYQGNIEKAKEYLNKALELDPNYPLALEMQKELNK